MGWTLAPAWKMALVVAAAGAVVFAVNVYAVDATAGALEWLSLASAAFIVALGLALLVRPERTE